VVHELRERILSHDLRPGQRLVERTLSAQLEVSRIPLREAILQLQTEGLVEVRPRHGAVVATVPEQEIEDFFAVREALEPLAARLAAMRADDAALADLRARRQDEISALASGDLDVLERATAAFHAAIVDAANSSLLASVMRPLRTRARWQTGIDRELGLRALSDEHEQLYRAIAAHDAETAARLGQLHASGNGAATIAALRQRSG
jgi:DNA-binding GntR family transcriptional regulator